MTAYLRNHGFEVKVAESIEAIYNVLKNCSEHMQKQGRIAIKLQEGSVIPFREELQAACDSLYGLGDHTIWEEEQDKEEKAAVDRVMHICGHSFDDYPPCKIVWILFLAKIIEAQWQGNLSYLPYALFNCFTLLIIGMLILAYILDSYKIGKQNIIDAIKMDI